MPLLSVRSPVMLTMMNEWRDTVRYGRSCGYYRGNYWGNHRGY